MYAEQQSCRTLSILWILIAGNNLPSSVALSWCEYDTDVSNRIRDESFWPALIAGDLRPWQQRRHGFTSWGNREQAIKTTLKWPWFIATSQLSFILQPLPKQRHFIAYSLTSKNIRIIIYELILRGYHENAILQPLPKQKNFIAYSSTSKNIRIIIYELILRGYHENAILQPLPKQKNFIAYLLNSKNIRIIIYELILRDYLENAILQPLPKQF